MDYQSQIKKEKNDLRKKFFDILKNLSPLRKKEASQILVQFFHQFLKKSGSILSFISFPSEINTAALNTILVKENKLFLPSFYNPPSIFKVNSEKTLSLLKNCKKSLYPQKLFYPDIVIIPGLAFSTTTNHRLGRGLGWYDIYLSQLPSSSISIGIGFQEQRYQKLPLDSHDIPLKKLFLF